MDASMSFHIGSPCNLFENDIPDGGRLSFGFSGLSGFLGNGGDSITAIDEAVSVCKENERPSRDLRLQDVSLDARGKRLKHILAFCSILNDFVYCLQVWRQCYSKEIM